MPCGEKTRRGGPQDTVRISVLEKIIEDQPEWAPTNILAFLKGHLDQREQNGSMRSDETYYSGSPECEDRKPGAPIEMEDDDVGSISSSRTVKVELPSPSTSKL